MLTIFKKDDTLAIQISDGCETCVHVAALDLQTDLRRLSGKWNAFPIENSCTKPCIRILTADEAQREEGCVPKEREGYTVAVDETGVSITGADALGTVYGIYAFCDRILGVDPMYHITGVVPGRRDCFLAENCKFADYPKGPRFRGWFLNDEDLLSGFRGGGGKRNLDYPFYQNVISPLVLEEILETAARLGLNMIIPASFLDIENPAEERLAAAVCRRGLYISQHHIEPMGVSYFAAENFLKRRGHDEEISFVRNRARMEEIWTHYAKKWALYGDRVIWQLGLRGRADVPVWQSDRNIPTSDRQRGAVISDAVAAQHDIACAALKRPTVESTVTLWMEGAKLYEKQLLCIPKDTAVIFSDVGINQMFSDDFYRVNRCAERRYGVYYHAAFWGSGPHLADGCNPEKMVFSYREAMERDTLDYSLLNVSNLREVHISARINASLVWDPARYRLSRHRRQLYTKLYGGHMAEKIETGYCRFYEAFADLGEAECKRQCGQRGFHYHAYGQLPFVNYSAQDGCLKKMGMDALEKHLIPEAGHLRAIKQSEQKLSALLAYWEAVAKDVPTNRRTYFESFPVLQTRYMLLLTKWCLACCEYASERLAGRMAARKAGKAAAFLRKIVCVRKAAETGKWNGWYDGDQKMGIREMLEKTLEKAGKAHMALHDMKP